MSRPLQRQVDRQYARQVAAAVLDALTRPVGTAGVPPVEVNDRQAAELFVAAAVLQVVRTARRGG
jgi:citrate lyase gamma subunit